MILIVSNRNVIANENVLFGENKNQVDLGNLRVAVVGDDKGNCPDVLGGELAGVVERVGKIGKGTRVHLFRDVKVGGKAVSEALFARLMAGVAKGEVTPEWLVFVHGFNTSFTDSVALSRNLERNFGVNVILFSWPSNPGPQLFVFKKKEYERARLAAGRSALALDRLLEKLGSYLGRYQDPRCRLSLNFMSYSLGNFLLESYIRSPHFFNMERETAIFDNMVLCQADVTARSHHVWVPGLQPRKRLYVTHNEHDIVLNFSDKVQAKRLGQTVEHSRVPGVTYVDFTDGDQVGRTHRLFELPRTANQAVFDFFYGALRGRLGEQVEGLIFNERLGVFELAQRQITAQWVPPDQMMEYGREVLPVD